MAITSTTGASQLPDIGTLSYNGCVFGPYFETNFSGVEIKDAAKRTVIYVEYTLTVDGFVTLGATDTTTDRTMSTLQNLLSQQGGILKYTGKGFCNLVVNAQGGLQDVCWGPVPETLDFQTLGAGRSAKIKWTVKFRIPYKAITQSLAGAGPPVLQFNEETSVTYDDEGFSRLRIKGILEIPLTRSSVNTRTLTTTVDDYRQRWMTQIAASVDLTRFRVTNREFNVSRDKRTMEWEFAAEELPYMAPPPFSMNARGTYDVKKSNAGLGFIQWNCTLRSTFTIRKDLPRRTAWESFLVMLQWRMNQSVNSRVPDVAAPAPDQQPPAVQNPLAAFTPIPAIIGFSLGRWLRQAANNAAQAQAVANDRRCFLIDFGVTEGMYLDSRTVTFTASWRLITTLSHILLASGIWTKPPTFNSNLWAASVADVSGWTSWLSNRLDANQDVIVDFGF